MGIEFDQLKKRSIRLTTERRSINEVLTASPTSEHLSSETLQRLVEVPAAIGGSRCAEVAAHQPHLESGAQ
ncbi:MAG: hypothetical protein WCA28_17160 [Bradyrhizobium sp.]